MKNKPQKKDKSEAKMPMRGQRTMKNKANKKNK